MLAQKTGENTMRSPVISLLALVLIGVSPSSAAYKGCYQRLYTNADLANSVAQTVDGVQVQLGQTGGGEEDEDMLTIKLMTGSSLFFARLICQPKTSDQSGSLTCKTDNAGESLRIDTRPKGMKVTLLTDLKIPEEAMGGDINLDLKKGPANGVFALTKVSSGYCDKDKLAHR
jgi:hypothetical protein